MARGFCPNQECPNIDFLDTARPCPTCGREAKELTPKEYWRARTIKLMHANEIAEIAEIQEVARRALGEASPVPQTQEPEETSSKEERGEFDEASQADLAETTSSPQEIESGEPEVSVVELSGATEEASHIEGPLAVEAESEKLGEIPVHAEPTERAGTEGAQTALESGAVSSAEGPSELPANQERPESLQSENAEGGGDVSVVISEIDEVLPLEGTGGIGADSEDAEEDSTSSKMEEGAGTEISKEAPATEGAVIEEVKEEAEESTDATDTELPELRGEETVFKQPTEEISAPDRLPDDGGVGRPAGAVRIITFREGSMEIGICPYCGRFVRGSDLGRHKLKHRFRNVFGLQSGD